MESHVPQHAKRLSISHRSSQSRFGSHGIFFANTFWQYGLQLVKYLFPLATLPYLTRVLKPQGYAVYAYVTSFMTFVQVLVDFGFNLSGVKRVIQNKNPDALSRTTAAITQARLLLSGIVAVGVAAITVFIPILRTNALYTAFAYIAICGKSLAPDFLFQGMEKMRPLTSRYFVSKGISTVLTFVVVHSMNDLLWIPVLDIISSLIALVWSFAAAHSLFGSGIQLVPLRESLLELKTSAYYALSNLASTAFSGFVTLLIGIAIKDKSQVSYWSIALTTISAVQTLYGPISNSLYPHMVSTKDFSFAKKLMLLATPVLLVGTITYYWFADFIILILGGKSYLAGSYVIRLVSPVIFISFYGIMFGWPVLGAVGKVKELTMTTIISSAVSVVALVTVTWLGFASVAIFAVIRSLTELLMCVLRGIVVLRVFRKKKSKHSVIAQ